jgi:hypothetical protein
MLRQQQFATQEKSGKTGSKQTFDAWTTNVRWRPEADTVDLGGKRTFAALQKLVYVAPLRPSLPNERAAG